MLQQAKDLLSFKAFKPSKHDVKVPLVERFLGEGPLMGISISKDCLSLAEIEYTHNSAIVVKNVKSCTFSTEEEMINAIISFAKGNELFYTILLNSPGIQVIKLDKDLSKKGIDRICDAKHEISQIQEMIKEQVEEGRAYAYASNRTFPETLIFSYDQTIVDYNVNLVNSLGLEVVRTGCGIYGILNYLFNENSEFFHQDKILFIYSNDSLIIGSIGESKFQQVGFRSNIVAKDLQCHISRMIERFDHKHSQLSYINCSHWPIEMYFTKHYPGLKISPIFQDSFIGTFESVCHG